jgi:hypothetical protein
LTGNIACAATRLHQRIGRRMEEAYGARAHERAAELAMHFVRGREPRRAVEFLNAAARRALERSAHREAVGCFRQALELLTELPDDDERARLELDIQIIYAPALAAIRGWADADVEQAFLRAREVCERLKDESRMFPCLYGLAEMHELRGEFETCQETLARANPERRRTHPRLDGDGAVVQGLPGPRG